MEEEDLRLTRQELYDLVWSKPLSKLSSDFQVSDVGLAKICKRLEIPRPKQGYWTRLMRGKGVEGRPPLTDISDAAATEIVLTRRTSRPAPATREPVPRVDVPAILKDPLQPVVRTRRRLEQARPDSHGILRARGRDVLSVETSEENLARALLLVDALLKALQARGHTVKVISEPKPTTVLTVLDESLSFTLKERLHQRDHEMTAEEEAREARYGRSYAPRFDYRPSGLLRIRVAGMDGSLRERTWSDGKRWRLETSLGQVVLGIEETARIQRAERRRWAAERERWERERIRQAEERDRAREELLRIHELQKMAHDWKLSQTIHDFLRAAEDRLGGSEAVTDAKAWLEWGHSLADAVDPLTRLTPTGRFGPP